jgi:hypothetical protein
LLDIRASRWIALGVAFKLGDLALNALQVS